MNEYTALYLSELHSRELIAAAERHRLAAAASLARRRRRVARLHPVATPPQPPQQLKPSPAR